MPIRAVEASEVAHPIVALQEDEEKCLRCPTEEWRAPQTLLERNLQAATQAQPRSEAPEKHPVKSAVVIADDEDAPVGTKGTIEPPL